MGTKTTQTRHMSINIEGLVTRYRNRSMTGLFDKEDGSPASDIEARKYLNECIAKGWKVLPMCDESKCPDFDYFGGGCPGHNKQTITE